MKKLFCAAAALALAAFAGTSALATSYNAGGDIDYTGVLGSYYEQESPDMTRSATRITLSSGVSFDTSLKLYYYYAAGISSPFTANVMTGMITQSAVMLTVPDGISAELYADGELYSGDLTSVTAPGSYVLTVKSNAGVTEQVLSFRIAGENTCSFTGYQLPDGFSVTGVTFNGNRKTTTGSFIDFSEEGDYSVDYACPATGESYHIAFAVDRTPPELKLEAVKDGKSWGEVDISDVEPGGKVTVYRNGEKEEYTSVLTKSGQYTLVVADAAGNKTTYDFTIMIYFNSGTFFFFLCLALIVVGTGAYVFISRKKLRVR